MKKNHKAMNRGTKSSKGQFGDGYFSQHKGKQLQDTEHHARMGHEAQDLYGNSTGRSTGGGTYGTA